MDIHGFETRFGLTQQTSTPWNHRHNQQEYNSVRTQQTLTAKRVKLRQNIYLN